MKLSALGLFVLGVSLVSASAQVTVEVTQDQEQYLPGEAMQVAVRITNRSGQTLRLGADEDWLTFEIESTEGLVVPKLDEPPVTGEFVLESSKVAIKRLDLGPYFAFTQTGRYGIIATVRIRSWGFDKASPPKYFNIIEGAKLWEQEVGVPTPNTNSVAPEVRKFVLQQANYIKGQLRLYLRVTDPYGRTFRVVPVGSMVSFSHPQPQIDHNSNLHVLYQNGATTFNYSVFDFQGELLVRQTYDYLNAARPRLRGDDEGNISVTGGSRRYTSNDVPAPLEPPDVSDSSTSAPPKLASPPAATPPAVRVTPPQK
jgi:hypothetical protein